MIFRLMSSDSTLPPDEIKAKIESIARISPMGEGPPASKDPSSPVIPPHHSQHAVANNVVPPSKSATESSLISLDDDEDEFVDAHE